MPQTISVPGVPNPTGTVPKASSESLEAQNGARAPSKKLGMQERQYSVDDIRQMMRLTLTGQARSARLAAEQVGIPTATTTAVKRAAKPLQRGGGGAAAREATAFERTMIDRGAARRRAVDEAEGTSSHNQLLVVSS